MTVEYSFGMELIDEIGGREARDGLVAKPVRDLIAVADETGDDDVDPGAGG